MSGAVTFGAELRARPVARGLDVVDERPIARAGSDTCTRAGVAHEVGVALVGTGTLEQIEMDELGRRRTLDAKEGSPEVLRSQRTGGGARQPGSHGALRRDLDLERTGTPLGTVRTGPDLPGSVTL